MTDSDESSGGESGTHVGRPPFTDAELSALAPEGSRLDPPTAPRAYGSGVPSDPPGHPSDHHPTTPLRRPTGYGTGEPTRPGDTGPLARYGTSQPGGPQPAGTGYGSPGAPGGQPSGRPPYPTPSSSLYPPTRPHQAPPGMPQPPQPPQQPQPQPPGAYGAPGRLSPPPPGGRSPYAPGGPADRPGWAAPPGSGLPPAPPQRPGFGPAPQPFPADPFAPRPKPKRRVPAVALVAAIVVTALVCGALGGVAGGVVQAQRDKPTPSPSQAAAAGSINAVVKQLLPSVVSVMVPQSDGSEFVGAGSVISDDGYIMTNEHVVSTTKTNGSKVKVEFNDGEQVDATVKGMSSTADIAVLKVDRSGLKPVTFGDSAKVQVGDRVIAIGNPLGLAETTTSGIVSALNRPVHVNQHSDSYYAAIQTDAAINPGNSGGPLFDIRGRMIGVNYAGAARQNVGLGFAIPERSARRTAQELIKTGKATHAVIGVYTDTSYTGDGAKISDDEVGGNQPVSSGGPADRAGLQAGDVITKIQGIPIHSSAELTAIIRTQAPGDVVTTVYKRSGAEATTKMTLGEESDK